MAIELLAGERRLPLGAAGAGDVATRERMRVIFASTAESVKQRFGRG